MVVPEAAVVALAPVAELLVPRKAVAALGQPEEPGGRRTVAVAGEYILERTFVFNGVNIFSFFARRQSAALQFDRIVMSQGFWFFQNPAGFSIRKYAPVYLALVLTAALYSAYFKRGFCGGIVRRDRSLFDNAARNGNHEMAVSGSFNRHAVQDDRIEIGTETAALCAGGCPRKRLALQHPSLRRPSPFYRPG
jgi:hypothetical protein